MVQEKALTFAKELNVGSFQASDGWLRQWNERNYITFKTVSGELKSVTPEMVDGGGGDISSKSFIKGTLMKI